MKRAHLFANTEWYLYNFRLSLARANAARERVVTHFSLERCFDDMMHKHQNVCE